MKVNLEGLTGLPEETERNQVVRDKLKVSSVLLLLEGIQLKWFGRLSKINGKKQVNKVWKGRIVKRVPSV